MIKTQWNSAVSPLLGGGGKRIRHERQECLRYERDSIVLTVLLVPFAQAHKRDVLLFDLLFDDIDGAGRIYVTGGMLHGAAI